MGGMALLFGVPVVVGFIAVVDGGSRMDVVL